MKGWWWALLLIPSACLARPLQFATVPGGAEVVEDDRVLASAPREVRSTYRIDLDDSRPHALVLRREHFDLMPLNVSWDPVVGSWKRTGDPLMSYVQEGTVVEFSKAVEFNASPADFKAYLEPAISDPTATHIEVAGVSRSVVPLLQDLAHRYIIPSAYEPRPIYLVPPGREPRMVVFGAGELDTEATLVPTNRITLGSAGGHTDVAVAVVLTLALGGGLAWLQLVYRPQHTQMRLEMSRQRELITALQQAQGPTGKSRATTTVTTQGGETFVLLEKLGQGAMGAVYRARRNNAGPGGKDEYWAVKTMMLSKDPALVQRFKHEIKVCSRLIHPGIVKVLDWGHMQQAGTEGGVSEVLFAVMELVPGKTLSRVLAEAPGRQLPVEQGLSILLDTLYAMRFAHGQGVIHRDIKPDNLMITDAGRVKVLDFGVAKVNDATQTLGNFALGTPRYMSPEHFDNKNLTPAADIFSLGVVFHELLTGQNPFHSVQAESSDVWAMLGRMLVTPGDSLSSVGLGFAPELCEVADKMIHVPLERRYQSVDAVLADLLLVVRQCYPQVPLRTAIEEDGPIC